MGLSATLLSLGWVVVNMSGYMKPAIGHMWRIFLEASFYLISKFIHFYVHVYHGIECKINRRFLRSNTQLLRIFRVEVSWATPQL